MPSEKEIKSLITGLLSNEKLHKATEGIFTGLKQCKNFDELAGKLVTGMSDPEVRQAISGTLQNTVLEATAAASKEAKNPIP
jgi:hypothetical protein